MAAQGCDFGGHQPRAVARELRAQWAPSRDDRAAGNAPACWFEVIDKILGEQLVELVELARVHEVAVQRDELVDRESVFDG